MTYFITALTDDKAKIIIAQSQTDNAAIAEMIASIHRQQGYAVIVRSEG